MSTESPPRVAVRPPPSPRSRVHQEPADVPALPGGRTFTPALATAGLLWLSYFPVNWGWLGWVALVPFLTLVHSPARPRRVYFSAWVGAMAFFAVALQWVRVSDYRQYATWVALSIWCSLYWLAAIYLLRKLARRTRLPLTLTLPVVWTGLEFARAHLLLGGFAWYFLGHTQHAYLPLIQTADLAGAYAVTFVAAAVNALIYDLVRGRRWFQILFGVGAPVARLPLVSLRFQTALVLLLVGGTLGYGVWRLQQREFAVGPRIALLQGNLDQRLRNAATSPEAAEQVIGKVRHHYRRLCDEASLDHPQLVIWPETSFVYGWDEVSGELAGEPLDEEWREADAERRGLARRLASRFQVNQLLGLLTRTLGPDRRARRANSAVLVTAEGEIAGRYDKIHCVPFGEYVPFRDWLPWLNAFAPYDFDYSITPGTAQPRLELENFSFGVLICFEDTDAALARQYLWPDESEPAVDFLVNISNDGWFDGTSEHEEHLAICRFRAVECRRAVARAVNMGISAVIDPNGAIVALPRPTWAESKKVEAVVTAAVPLDSRRSLYVRLGDWLPWSCWAVIGVALFWPSRFRAAKE